MRSISATGDGPEAGPYDAPSAIARNRMEGGLETKRHQSMGDQHQPPLPDIVGREGIAGFLLYQPGDKRMGPFTHLERQADLGKVKPAAMIAIFAMDSITAPRYRQRCDRAQKRHRV